MSKPYPEMIVLKRSRCPLCGAELGCPPLERVQGRVQALCPNGGCDFRTELFWLGDLETISN